MHTERLMTVLNDTRPRPSDARGQKGVLVMPPDDQKSNPRQHQDEPNRTEPNRAVPCRAVPCRAVPCRARSRALRCAPLRSAAYPESTPSTKIDPRTSGSRPSAFTNCLTLPLCISRTNFH
jgi:hypothetical protein